MLIFDKEDYSLKYMWRKSVEKECFINPFAYEPKQSILYDEYMHQFFIEPEMNPLTES